MSYPVPAVPSRPHDDPAVPLPALVRFLRHPVTAIVGCVVLLVVYTLGGLLVSLAVAPLVPAEGAVGAEVPTALVRLLVAAGMTAFAVALVIGYRRLARVPFSAVGVRPLRRAWVLLPAMASAYAVMVLGGLLSVTVGGGRIAFDEVAASGALLVGISIVSALLTQAFPEELLFRGHLMTLLEARFRPWAVIATSAVLFGAIHWISQSNADSLVERILYVGMAAAFGFAGASFFWVTRSLWGAVGIHWGLHTSFRTFPIQSDVYALEVGAHIVGFVLIGVVVLLVGRRIGRTREVALP